MGACQSSANNPPRRNMVKKSITSLGNKQIREWDENDVYNWLCSIYDGELKELAIKFRKSVIRGRVLQDIDDEQLNEMGIKMGNKLSFKKARMELFQPFANNNPQNSTIPSPITDTSNDHPPQHINLARFSSNHSTHSNHSNHSSNHSNSNHSNHIASPNAINIPTPITIHNLQTHSISSEGRMRTRISGFIEPGTGTGTGSTCNTNGAGSITTGTGSVYYTTPSLPFGPPTFISMNSAGSSSTTSSSHSPNMGLSDFQSKIDNDQLEMVEEEDDNYAIIDASLLEDIDEDDIIPVKSSKPKLVPKSAHDHSAVSVVSNQSTNNNWFYNNYNAHDTNQPIVHRATSDPIGASASCSSLNAVSLGIHTFQSEMFEIALFIQRNMNLNMQHNVHNVNRNNNWISGRDIVNLLRRYNSNMNQDKYLSTAQLLLNYQYLISLNNFNKNQFVDNDKILYKINLNNNSNINSKPMIKLQALNPSELSSGCRVWLYINNIAEWMNGVILEKDAQNLVKISVYNSLSQITNTKYIQLPDERVQLTLPYNDHKSHHLSYSQLY